MRVWFQSALRCASGLAFVAASVYCLLAYLPYTYFALIKFPAYAWMPWFAGHFGGIYLCAVALWVGASLFEAPGSHASQIGWARIFWKCSPAVLFGVYLLWRPVLRDIDNSAASYLWGLTLLAPLVLLSVQHLIGTFRNDWTARAEGGTACSFSAGLGTALVVSLSYALFAQVERGHLSGAGGGSAITLTAWTLASHIVLAVSVLVLLHGIAWLAAKTPYERSAKRVLTLLAVFGGLWVPLARALNAMLSFGGWRAEVYAAGLALALTMWGAAVVSPLWTKSHDPARDKYKSEVRRALLPAAVLTGSAWVALYAPRAIGGSDWNGMFRSLLTFGFWIIAGVCVYAVWPKRTARYSVAQVAGLLIITAALYSGLRVTEIYWSRALGSTDDEISLALVEYGGHDASFALVNSLLGNTHQESCGDLCRILREYTNVRNAHANVDVELTRHLVRAAGPRPNIFLFVIDSMRPDYLGAYNPNVDYTPNLDALAREGVALRNVYTQYAGTSLSEPAIWAGATLLHAHYMQPFSRVNSLDRMLQTDGYRRIVSMDEVLSEILPPDSDVVALDRDKKLWNELEIGSTLQQAEKVLDQSAPQGGEQPIFLYAQPKNVHQFARNQVPSPTAMHWPDRPGLNTRITYEVHYVDERLGEFINDLKRRGLYENSIIVVTSDHGDATGEFGRTSHSTSIWPEIMRVPLIIRLPKDLRVRMVHDDSRVSSLIDITPTLYSLLGHGPIEDNPQYGRPLLAETQAELDRYPQRDLLLASDVRAVYGMLAQNGRYLYVTYDSPAQSYLFDLLTDPNAQHSILNAGLKQSYDQNIIEHLHQTASFYGYRPGVDSLLAASTR